MAGALLTSCPNGGVLDTACASCLETSCAGALSAVNNACASVFACACPLGVDAAACAPSAPCTSSLASAAANCTSCNSQCSLTNDGGIVDAAVSDSGVDAGPISTIDGGQPGDASEDGGPTDLTWAQWPMPNSPVDVEAGAPNLQSYTAAAGTVTDNVTGLMWQQTPAAADGGTFPQLAQADAVTYCTGLNLAGHQDWRLPTVIELASILDYNVQSPGPTINQTSFPGTPGGESSAFWTLTPAVWGGNVGGANQVFFYDGQVDPNPVTETAYLRCVRGGTGPFAASPGPAPAGRYTIPATGTVLDTKTLLTWEQTPEGDAGSFPKMLQTAAVTYCANLGLSGGGWRLPTANELETLVDFSQTSSTTPSIDVTFFPDTPAEEFWSATPVAPVGIESWEVGFAGGGAGSDVGSEYSWYVRCVR